MKLRKTFGMAALVVASLAVGAYVWNATPSRTPSGQPPLVEMDHTAFETFRTDFNGAADSFRLIVLLSPT